MIMTRRILHEIYLFGYSGRPLPRWIRRMFARSEVHRAWLLGSTGCFSQAGVRYGPAHPYGNARDLPDLYGAMGLNASDRRMTLGALRTTPYA